MYVCLCHGITDKAIEQAVAAGANSMPELKKQLGVATQCGKCATATKQLLLDLQAVENADFYDAA